MLKPSYAELMDVLNENAGKNDEVTSRYTIVIAAAKRARQLIDGDTPMVEERKGKPLSTAVEEIAEGKIQVVPEGEGTVLEIYRQRELREEIENELMNNNASDDEENTDSDDDILSFDDDDDTEDAEDAENIADEENSEDIGNEEETAEDDEEEDTADDGE